jgi:phosphoglycerate dehydrogenase-like enzyme
MVGARRDAQEAIRVSGALRIHVINPPDDKAEYAIHPDVLRDALRDLAQAREVSPVITESPDPAEVTPEMRRAHVLIGHRVPHRSADQMAELRWLHLTSAGVDHVLPLDWLPRGVTLTNSSGVHAEHAAEYALCALLMLNIGFPQHIADQQRGRWDQVFHSPIRGKTVVLIGVGAIGGAAARRAKQAGLHVIGVRRSRRPHRYVDETVGPDALAAVLPRADFLLVTAPLTPETRSLIGRRELDLLRQEAGVVCMSRAGLVDYDALAERLRRGRLRGAIVDVCDPEPLPPASPLWRVPNLIITPHISSDPPDYAARVIAILKENVGRFLDGRPLMNRIARSRGY